MDTQIPPEVDRLAILINAIDDPILAQKIRLTALMLLWRLDVFEDGLHVPPGFQDPDVSGHK